MSESEKSAVDTSEKIIMRQLMDSKEIKWIRKNMEMCKDFERQDLLNHETP